MRRTNRKYRIPIDLYPCREEKEEEEEEEKEKEESEKKGSKEASEIGSKFESSGYAASDNEVESDLESTARSEPKCKEMKDTCESGIQPKPDSSKVVPAFIRNGGNGNGGNNGYSYKGFLACNPRDYNGKGGAVALTRWFEKMESVIENSGCAENQKVKYAASSFINKAFTWWNTHIQARGHEAAIGMTWVEFKALLVEEANHAGYTDQFHELAKPVPHLSDILKARILTGEAIRCGTLTRSSEKRKELEETSKQGGSWKDNKKEKVRKGFVATAPPRNENVGLYPKCAKCSVYHPESGPYRLCFNCQKPGHFARDYRAPIRLVMPVSVVRMGNNQRVCYECGSSKHLRNTCPKLDRATVDALQDLNIVTGTFSLNDHFATVLFDSEADFNFISTKFAPLLNVKPSIVSPGYVTEVANGKKEEVDRIIHDCKLEPGNSLFTIDLILLGHGSFDVIVGMD
ncbi:reverse transcriptase domain-containing protein [Tanacetum coccineum]